MTVAALVARAALAGALVACAAAAPAGAARVLGHEAVPTSVTAFRGHVVWSSYHPRTRTYSLREWFRGRTRTLPVPRRHIAFDVDLGPGPSGAVTAVYSRCKSDGGGNLLGDEGQFGAYTESSDCDLYELPLAAARERRLHVRGGRRASEYLPTIWRNRLVFARIFERRKGRRGVYQYLYSADVAGRQRPQRVSGGTRGIYPNTSLDSHPFYAGGPGPTALDLRGARLAFAWNAVPDGCRPGDEPDRLSPLLSELWIVRIGHPGRRVDHACSGDTTLWLATPSLGPRRLFYYRQRSETGSAWGSHLRTLDIRHARLSDRRLPSRTVAIAHDGRATYCVHRVGSRDRVAIVRL